MAWCLCNTCTELSLRGAPGPHLMNGPLNLGCKNVASLRGKLASEAGRVALALNDSHH